MVSGKLAARLAMLLLAASIRAAHAEQAGCPGNPHALGVSRIIEVDPTGGPRFGTFQYKTTLELQPNEVVLTFDDGPSPKTTLRVLDALDQHCVKATFFEVGRWAEAFPEVTKAVADRGHTLASHSYSHPRNLGRLPLEQAEQDIDRGFTALKEASLDRVAPFFRYPGLNDSDALNAYLGSRNVAIVSCDIGTDDWMGIGAAQIVKRTLARLERQGKGIILLHETEPATARALPMLLDELEKRGYRLVHMVPKAQGVAALKPPGATPPPTSQ
jgi:peptidoglycan/xylan/chitin deacetylase (PgdA/CDA1 family)